ncbi:MAG: DUF4140 domain-containing protein, partial [Myxococcota bacterium]|nr:DUF4140 domain-containing protein [Myxococcota bacterium]
MTEHSIIERTLRVATRATAVTFFEDRAEIRRHAQVELAAGTHRLELGGLSPLSDDRSLQVKALGEGATSLLLSGARVLRRLISAEEYARSELAELEQNLRRAREARGAVLRQSARIVQRRTHMKKLFEQFCRSLARVPSRAAEDELAGWRTSWAELLSAESIARSQLHTARCEELKLELELARAEARLRERRGEEPRSETWAEVQLDAKAAGVYDFELSYRCPCALWRPEHWAQLRVDEGDAGQGTIELVTYATAWQATGERW